MGRRQRFKLTGKLEKPICAMVSEAAGEPVASLLLFITYFFAKGCLPGYLRQILPERAASASLSICCPALTTILQSSREGSEDKIQVWSKASLLPSVFFHTSSPLFSDQILQTNIRASFIPNGIFCHISAAQTGSLTCHTAS